MKDFEQCIKSCWKRQRGLEFALKKFLAGTALVGAAVLLIGFYEGDQELVEEIYTV